MQSQRKYSIKDDHDLELLLAHIGKMQNTAKVETSAIYKIALLTKVAVGTKKPDVSNRNVWVVQQANIKQIAIDAKRLIIFYNAKKI